MNSNYGEITENHLVKFSLRKVLIPGPYMNIRKEH